MSVRSGQQVYEQHLRRLFDFEPLRAGKDVRLAIRALFMPEFHPEVAVLLELKTHAPMATLDVHSAQRSVWKHMSAVAAGDSTASNPDCAEPDVAEETLKIPAAKLADVESLASKVTQTPKQSGARGVSGLNILLEIASSGTGSPYSETVRLGVDRTLDRLCVTLLERASEVALWQQSKEALSHVRSYVR